MSETTSSSGKAWTDDEVQQLRELAAGNTPVGVMSIRLNRTEDPSVPRHTPRGSHSHRRTDRRTVT